MLLFDDWNRALWERIHFCCVKAFKSLKYFILNLNIAMAISRTQTFLDLFVFIWMRSSCWIHIWQWKFELKKNKWINKKKSFFFFLSFFLFKFDLLYALQIRVERVITENHTGHKHTLNYDILRIIVNWIISWITIWSH